MWTHRHGRTCRSRDDRPRLCLCWLPYQGALPGTAFEGGICDAVGRHSSPRKQRKQQQYNNNKTPGDDEIFLSLNNLEAPRERQGGRLLSNRLFWRSSSIMALNSSITEPRFRRCSQMPGLLNHLISDTCQPSPAAMFAWWRVRLAALHRGSGWSAAVKRPRGSVPSRANRSNSVLAHLKSAQCRLRAAGRAPRRGCARAYGLHKLRYSLHPRAAGPVPWARRQPQQLLDCWRACIPTPLAARLPTALGRLRINSVLRSYFSMDIGQNPNVFILQ